VIHDAAGKELARAEAGPGQLDPTLIWTVPAEGNYTVRVQERLKTLGVKHEFAGNATRAEQTAADIDFDSPLMRLASGGRTDA